MHSNQFSFPKQLFLQAAHVLPMLNEKGKSERPHISGSPFSGKISHKMVGCTLKNWSLHTPSTLDSLLTWLTSRVEGVFDAESISSGS